MPQATRRDSLGRVRRPEQDMTTFRPAIEGRVSRSHNVNMTPEAHEAFARLTAQERGDLIQSAMAPNREGVQKSSSVLQ